MINNKREKTLEILEKIVFPLEEKCLHKKELCHNDGSCSSAIYLHKKNDCNIGGFPAGRFLLKIPQTLELNKFQEMAIDYLDNTDYVDWIYSTCGDSGEKHFELKVRFLEEEYVISCNNLNRSYQYNKFPHDEDIILFVSEFERLVL
jgi:hypothetical protein